MSIRKNLPLPAPPSDNIRLGLASVRDILRDTMHNYRANGDTNQAAAIALYAILSILPLFILTLLLIDSLFGTDPAIQKKLIEGIRQLVPSFSGELLTQFGEIARDQDLLGWVGIVSLIWFSALIFNAIEMALNITFRSRIYRNYLVSKLLAIAMIPLGWTVGVVSVGITYVATIIERQPLLGQGGIFFFPLFHSALSRIVFPYLITVLFFTVLYKVIPTGRVSLKSALIGSAIFSALMEIAKQFFTWYVASYTRYNVIFGSLETVVILVIWVFYTAVILLFCAELISSYQRRDMLLIEKTLLKRGRNHPQSNERLFRKFGRPYARGEYVFHEGDIGQNTFYILSGRIRLEKSAGQVKRILTEMGPGQYFGEIAALIKSPRTASALCLEESHIAVISGEMLRDILRENGEVALFMLREFSNRIRHANEALEELTKVWIRLMAVLYLIREWPFGGRKDPVLDLSEITGKEPYDVQETLTDLGRRGVLTFDDGRVTGFNREEALRLIDRNATQ